MKKLSLIRVLKEANRDWLEDTGIKYPRRGTGREMVGAFGRQKDDPKNKAEFIEKYNIHVDDVQSLVDIIEKDPTAIDKSGNLIIRDPNLVQRLKKLTDGDLGQMADDFDQIFVKGPENIQGFNFDDSSARETIQQAQTPEFRASEEAVAANVARTQRGREEIQPNRQPGTPAEYATANPWEHFEQPENNSPEEIHQLHSQEREVERRRNMSPRLSTGRSSRIPKIHKPVAAVDLPWKGEQSNVPNPNRLMSLEKEARKRQKIPIGQIPITRKEEPISFNTKPPVTGPRKKGK